MAVTLKAAVWPSVTVMAAGPVRLVVLGVTVRVAVALVAVWLAPLVTTTL